MCRALRLCHGGKALHTGTSFRHVPACHIQPTNQRPDKQGVGISASTCALYSRKAEVSLRDYFLKRRVTDVQSRAINALQWLVPWNSGVVGQ